MVDAGQTVLQVHALAQAAAQVPRDGAVDLRAVDLADLIGRVRQAVSEFPVVGQQDQALGVDVEAADVEQALVAAADVVAEVGAVRVVHRGDHADRLVEGEVDDALGGGDAHPVHADHRGLGVHAHALVAHDLAVDLDAAGGDQVLADPAAADPGLGQDLLEADAFFVGVREGVVVAPVTAAGLGRTAAAAAGPPPDRWAPPDRPPERPLDLPGERPP